MTGQTRFNPLSLNSDDTLPSLMLTRLPSRGLITISGADKKTYLQGQITCDVAHLDETESTLSAHCDPKGKMWSVFRLFHHEDTLAMFQSKSALERELAELKKYSVFSKVELTLSNDSLLGVIGDQAEAYIASLSNHTGNVRPIEGGTAVKISEQRWLLVIKEDQASALIDAFSGLTVTEDIWQLLDIREAIPLIEANNQNQLIPQNMNVQALNGICFSKGCYTGQETVARAKYRGTNKRAMYIVSGPIGHAPQSERLELERAVGDNWRSAGTLLIQYTYADLRATGLIILPNDLEEDMVLRLKDHADMPWTIEPLPYSLNDA